MNHVYKVVWNERSGTWVAVSEISESRGKRSRGKSDRRSGLVTAGRAALAIVATTVTLGVNVAHAADIGFNTNVFGALDKWWPMDCSSGCSGGSKPTPGSGDAVMYDNAATHADVTLQRKGGGTVGLHNVAPAKTDNDAVNLKQLKDAGLTVNASTGAVTNSVVTYDDNSKGKVTLNKGGKATTVANVASGKANDEAVNVKQLKDAGLNIDPTTGGVTNSFVAYDDNTKGKVTLNKGGKATTVANVASGKANDEAVNVKQLKDAGLNIDPTTGGVTNSFVAYDDSTKGKVTLNKGGKATTVANVASGKANDEAVNVKQLKDAGLNIDPTTGGVTNSFVAYDDSTKGKVTLNKGGKATTVANVASGKANDEAVNVKQLKDAGLNIDPTTGGVTNSFVAYDDSTKGKVTLNKGGKATTVANVASGKANDEAVNVKQLKDAGLNIDPTTGGVTNSFVAYDDSTKGKVTLNKGGKATTVANVASGKANDEAVNVKQLKDAGLTIDPTTGGVTNSFVAYDDNTKGKVTLNKGGKATTVANVASGKANDEAVNVKQLKDAGLNIDPTTGGVTNSFVAYDDSTKGKVTLNKGGKATTVANVASGKANDEAVNVKQLKDAGLNIDPTTGGVTNSFVAYDDSTKGKVTLNKGGDATTLANVASAKADDQAVNLKQLKDAGLNVDPTTGGVTNSFVAYDDSTKGKVTLNKGGDATTLANVASAKADDQAVNLKQLKDAGLNVDPTTGGVTNSFVAYDDSTKGKVTLNKGGKATTVANVASGKANDEAVNVKQLKDAGLNIDPTTGGVTNSFVAYDDSTKGKVTLNKGGDATTLANVASAKADDQAVNLKQLKDAGLNVDPTTGGVTNSFVAYDDSTKGKVTLNKGGDATTLANVASAKADDQAVNLKQLKDAGLNVDPTTGGVTNSFVAYDDSTKGKVTLNKGGDATTLANVASAKADDQAVNLKQLKDAGLNVDPTTGGVTNSFVAYDDNTKGKVTLNKGGKATTVANVASGKANDEAVNVKQLKDAGLNIDPTTGGVTNSFVAYDDSTKGKVTLNKGGKATTVANVASGKANDEAVNVKQLKDAGLNIDPTTGGVTNSFVAYDDSTKGKVTLNKGGKATTVANVASGKANDEAVNVKQLKDAGLNIDPTTGGVTNSFVAYDDSTKGKVTLNKGGKATTVANVASGKANDEAVNVKQLKDAGLNIDPTTGGVTNSFVAYDDSTKGQVTLNKGGNKPVTLANVAAAKADDQAVNLKQFKDAGLNVDPTTGTVTTSVVAYDDANKDKVTFNRGGNKPTTLANVATAKADDHAVNLKQLKDAGLNVDPTTGAATNSFVAYDDSTKSRVTLNKGGNKPTTLANVASGRASDEAVNVKQLKEAGLNIDPTTGGVTNSFVAYDDSTKSRVTLNKGGSRSTTIANVASGKAGDEAVNVKQLTDAGLNIDPTTGDVTNRVVAYDDPTKGRVTLNKGGSKPTTLANVASGRTNDEAVNVKQLKDAGLNIDPTTGGVTNSFVAYDDSSKSKVTLNKGGNATTVANLAAGKASDEAVNVKQLTDAGLVIDSTTGAATNSFVAYDDSTKGKVTLNKGGNATTLSNVAAGKASDEAVNVKQLTDAGLNIDPASGAATNSFVAYDDSTKGKVTLNKGGSATTLANVASAKADDHAVNLKQLKDAGLNIDPTTGGATNSFVAYDDGTKGKVTLNKGGNATTLSNVAAGKASDEAVNVKQLTDAGLVIDSTTGAATNSFVAYDDSTKGKVTLNRGGNATTLANVASAKADDQAVNLKQLKDAGLNIDPSTGAATNSFVAYDDSTKGKVSLNKGGRATTVSNVAAGKASDEAVNVKQLTDAGLVIDSTTGAATNSFVAYDDSTKGKVTLNKGGNATTLSNVAAGKASDEAVNVKQLTDAGLVIDSTTGAATNSFVAYDDSTKGKVTLNKGGNATTLANVAAAKADDQAVNLKQFKDAGLNVDPTTGTVTTSVVTYDDAKKDKVTFNKGADKSVTLANVAAAKADDQAVNLKQLKDAGLDVDPTTGGVTNSFVAYDDSTKSKVTLNKGGSATTLANVASAKADDQAVNLKQLKDAGLNIDPTTGGATNSFVAYDDSTKGKVTLNKGGNATTLSNIAAGKASDEAVNVKQLTDAGLVIDSTTGAATNSFVAYDDSTKGKVTLNKGGNATTLSNVAAGKASDEAVNVKQLTDAGLVIDSTTGAATNSFVAYDDSTKGKVTLNKGGSATTLANVASAKADDQAVNLKQLKDAGLNIDPTTGGATNSFVAYDDSTKGKVTLNKGGNATTLSNVAAGKASDEAVNVKQLTDAGLVIDSTTGAATNSFVAYDDSTKGKVTLNKGGNATTLSNVAAGKASDEAVNVKQLTDAGLVIDSTTGAATNSFVAYDDSTKGKVTLNKGGKATTLSNVAAGKTSDEAVNVKQLTDAGLVIDSTTGAATNSFVAYDDSTKGKVTLNKGGSATTLANVASAKADDQAVNLKQLKDAGLNIDPTTGGVTNSFVAYDDSSKSKVTLNKGGNATTVANLAAGKASDEAVNVKQLTDAGLVIDSTTGAATNSFVAYDDSTKGKVTLNKGGNATTLSNVAAGKASDEAVNVKQLTDAGLVIDSTTGAATNSFVAYDDSTKGKVTLNKDGKATTLANVAAGKASDEAVNVKQLTDAGLVIDSTTGAATNSFVAYDDSTKGKVTLNKGGKATTLANVAAGKASDEAVNVKQLTDAGLVIDSTTGAATNSFVAYDDSTKGKVTLNKGGNATTLANVAAAKADDQAVNLKQFKDAGLNVDPTTGTVTTSVVTYDDAKKDKVTFNKGADKSVTLANVAAAKADDQAVNLKQLKDAGLDVDPTTGGVTNSFVAYDDSTKSKVTLNKGGSATTLANVASAKADDQAVNLKQLKDAGLNIDPTTGGATNSFVAYDDSTKGKVTLNKGGNATTLSNLAAGKASDEAVNVKQLTDAGLVIDSTTGAATNSFVAYDDSTKGKVTLNKDGKATTLANVAAGKASDEAVNVKQLTDAGLVIDSTTGAATNSFVAYDDSTKGKVTLNKGGNATTLSNVAAGKASDEAVNVKQLTDAGLVIDSTTGAAMNSFVAYDDSTKGKVTLNKGGNATTLSNVAAGKASDEAVNVKQLTDAGLVIDSTTGAATNSFVAYDDSTKGKVTLNKGGKATTLANVAAGKASDEAVNVKQLTDAGLVIDSTTGAATNSFVAYDDSTKGKVTLNKGGKATTLANVAAAKADDQAVNLKQFKDAGLNVDPTTGTVTTSVVTYDDAKKDKVTFNKGADKPVTLANVAAAKADDQAVNLKQLKDAGLDVDPTTGDVTNSFVAYDDSTKGKVTLNKGGSATTLANVASAKADDQAVNLKQLKDAGLNIDPTTGGATNSFVAYDDSTKGKVTLNKGGNATTLSNLAAGKASDEAVNVKQLTDAGLVIDSTTGAATNSFVAYDDSTKGKVTLNKGGKATTLANVAAGKASDEAVNVKQLTDAGLVIDSTTGAATNSFVAYDDSTKGKVTLNKGGNATTLSNVAAGKASDEAVNVKQLTDAGLVIDSTTGAATNSFVAYDDSTKGKVTLNKDGKATTLASVAAGKASDEAVNVKQLTDAGLVIDSTTGAATNSFVAYDDSTKGKVTLNKGGSATTLANVASAKADDQAVNLKQLKDAGLNVDPTTGAATNSFVAYDDGTKGKVTLNKGGNATTLSNVAAGKASDEAVNVKQLQEAGLIIDPTTGDVTHGFVAYDDSTKEKVTFNRGGSATVLANVASAKADDQAVNLKQLKDAGLTVDPATGIATNSFVAYDDSTKARVTLNKGGMATTLSNVSMGMAETDAVNVKQLNQSVETVAVALGGGAGTDGKGGMTLPSYTINDAAGKPHEYHTVGSALSALTTSMQAIAPHLKYIKFGVSNAAQAQAAGTDSLAIGGNAFATGERALAMGRNARASGADTLALGVDSSASQINTVAIGANATVTSRDSVAIGLNSVANQANTFSVGSAANLRRVVNVAEATEGTDAVNLAQVNQLLAKSRVSSEPRLLRSSVYAATKSSLPPDELIASGPTNKGGQLEAIGVDAIAVGLNNHADGLGSVAIGSSVMNAADNAVGVGSNVMINGVNSVAIGSNVSTGADSAVAIGVQAVADADGAILIGNRSKVRRDAIDSVAIGNDITSATGRNNIVLGAGSDGSQDNVLSIGATGQERRIVNVAAGQGNTDAVNVSQLAGVANALGGGAKVNADGSIAAPKYTVGANTYSDVGNAVAALNANNEGYVSYDGSAKGAVTFNKGGDGTLLSNVAAGVSDRDAVNVKQMNDAIKAAASGAGNPLGVTYDSADKSTLTLSGQGGTRISNVAAGVNDSDAVNVKQLKDVGLITAAGETLAVTYEDASRTAVNFGGTTSVALNNVADGQVAAGSRQAVNGGQLFSLTQRVDGIDKEIARYISGGGSGGGSPFFAAAGDAAADKAVASGERSTAAGAGASATGTKATATGAGAVASANGATAIGAGASATADNAVAIGAGAVADRANAVSFGSVGQERMLTNVASVDPTDAANATSAINAATMNSAITQSAAQTLQSANQYTDRAISQMADRVNDVDRSAVRGIAAASALNNVTPYLPGRTSMNAGIAVYRGAPAIGVTVSRWNQKGNINLNGGVSSAGGNSTIVRVGAGFVF